ncbi:MAG: DUF1080 domain-containing protein [Verrucomicrobiota bacterium]
MKTRRQFLHTSFAAAAGACLPTIQAETSGDWKPLFDGKTFKGWEKTARINVSGALDKAHSREAVEAAIEKTLTHHREQNTPAHQHLGDWKIVDGAIEGGQSPAGSTLGAYLMTEKEYGDFELEYEMRPDWQTDTGVLLRQHPVGTIGFQVLCDHRPSGGIGGFFTNGLGSYLAAPVVVDGDVGEDFRVNNLREGKIQSKFPQAKVSNPATFEAFREVWNVNDWNTFRVRCVGASPILTVWINGLEMATLDTSTPGIEGYDPVIIEQRVGSRGHIGLEVHSNNPSRGWEQWAQGAVSRWRNIRLRELSL